MLFGHSISTTTDDDPLHFILNNQTEWDITIAACRLLFYVAIMTFLLMIVALIVKLLKSFDEEDSSPASGQVRVATETNRLLPKEVVQFSYGTCEGEDDDEESGKCSSNASGDLYDGKICVICYDQQRNCFFIPCGHCATCHICAKRIVELESKTCPVCRRYIHKVRKLFIP
ncbi:OLC1v1011543C12 [Oldenlandia corymbosa var. corymbosa]|uniref:OLC1v1011543C12 n=1 Tax=Oldenlandia corymbosa var. corymbosa TaxID=529605 RepID=A0AAV1DX14_OLDCO|nr:OLC1v1011543C12 [Oldenlandia corymbosa var. corymbosa]